MSTKSFKRICRALLTVIVCSTSAGLWAQTEVNVEKAGTLSDLLTTTDKQLKVTGSINGTDVKYLRNLVSEGTVTQLDLSGVKIVSGGVAYYENYMTENDVIGEKMFTECSQLRSIELPVTTTAILSNAFSRTGLLKVDIPNSVSRLGGDAFAYCKSLATVVIGRRVSNLSQGVFYSSAVQKVYAKPITPPSTPAYFFSSNPKIYVYTEALEDYKQSGWKNFGSIYGNLEATYPQDADSSAIVNNLCGTYFEDAACTTLKAEYKAMGDEELAAVMKEGGMPEYMVTIALKLKNETWAKYEQEFRIHSYKAYSDANYWNDKMMSSGGSFMGNPTGIFCKENAPLYVFVDQDIPSDATLYFAGCVDNDLISNAKSGVKLKKGLNIVDGVKDALYYVLYTADTKTKTKKLNEWPEMKIHIEGGTVNGYYDISRHKSTDYLFLLRRATHDLFTIKGEHSLLNFKKSAYMEVWPKTIDRSICWFDSMAVWQKDLMGYTVYVASGQRAKAPYCLTGGEEIYPTYYNNPNFAIQGDENSAGYANSSAYRTCYNSVGCIRNSLDVTRDEHDDWCVGHEVGHNNQRAISLEGGTEVSNNLFSNVCRFLTGKVTSSGHSLSESISEYPLNLPYPKRNISALMRMYYQLYLYYHQAQRNTSFYPKLFQAMRSDPMVLWGSNTNTSSLKFVRKVCEIANEDLTDFFEAWGFFEPCTNLQINDYGTNTMTTRLLDIKKTKAEIAKYPHKNREILFIEDRVDYVLTNGFFTTAGKKRRDSEQVGKCGDLGQYTDYIPGAEVERSSYTYVQSDSFYVMSGSGGVGFIMLDKDSLLCYASNSLQFCIPSGVKDDFTIYSVDADGALHEAVKSGEATEIVTLTQAGTLADSLSVTAIKATISGPLNGADIKYLRQLVNEGNLQSIDLSAANIVAGGVPYYETYRTSANTIGPKMFYECSNLISIRLPENITKIESNAFARSAIRSITIPDAVTTVGGDAFAYCSQLSMAIVGSKVKNMAQGVFYSSPVKEAFVKVVAPPTIASYLFSSKPIIHVFGSSFDSYKSSSWDNFGTLVGDLDDYGDITSVLLPEFVEKNVPVYDIQGRKVSRMLPGVMYIRNGKKFINMP